MTGLTPAAQSRLRVILGGLLLLALAHIGFLAREAAYRSLTVDDFIDLHNAWLVSRGQLPWMHAFTVHPTLQSWPLSLMFRVAGPDVVTHQWALWLVFALNLMVAALVVRHFVRLGQRSVAIVAFFLMTSSVLMLQHFGDIRPETFAAPCVLLSVELALGTILAGRPNFYFPGVLLACGCLMNQKCSLLVGSFGVFFLIDGPFKRAMTRGLSFGAGVATVGLLYLGMLLYTGTFDVFYQMNCVLPFKLPIPSEMWKKVMSPGFLGTMLGVNYFFALCCAWGFKWCVGILFRSSQREAAPWLIPDLPWPEELRCERIFVLCLTTVSLGFMLANPYPHLYNYLLMGPFLILLSAPCVAAALKWFAANPGHILNIVLIAGFVFADVLLPFRVGRHNLDGAQQRREIGRIHALVPPEEPIFDSSLRLYRPEATRNVPRVAFTGILTDMGVLPPVAPDLIRSRCRYVYWDDLLEEFLPSSDKTFIKENYVPVEGALWKRKNAPP